MGRKRILAREEVLFATLAVGASLLRRSHADKGKQRHKLSQSIGGHFSLRFRLAREELGEESSEVGYTRVHTRADPRTAAGLIAFFPAVDLE